MTTLAYVGLGSNLDEPLQQIALAVTGLAGLPGSQLLRRSRLYRSAPWGYTDQPAFVNAVVELETTLEPLALLAQLLAMETGLGRHRGGQRWGPRRIDLDLLLHGNSAISMPGLELPHPRISERAFVLMPLADLVPHYDMPGKGRIIDCLAHLDTADCFVIDEPPESATEFH